MSVAAADEPYVLHAVPGRIRVYIPGWSVQEKRALESQLYELQGVSHVQANALTGNILVLFNASITTEQTILEEMYRLDLDASEELDDEPAAEPGNPVTEVAGLEQPDLPGKDRPTYSLDSASLLEGSMRTLGSALGLGILASRQLLQATEPLPGATAALHIASVLGIAQSIPALRHGLRKRFGNTASNLMMNIPNVVAMALSENSLGLAVHGCESLRLWTDAYARRAAWHQHEEHVSNAPSAEPGATIQLETGERVPLAARVQEGAGTASGPDGLPLAIREGSMVPPGAQLHGGPFVLQLQDAEVPQTAMPEPRPVPLAPSFYERYLRVLSPLSLVYAGATALFTRSWSRTLAALLLVNPRAAMIGQECADLGASTRIVRAGCTMPSTRPHHTIQMPDVMLLGEMRVLTEGLELGSVVPLHEQYGTEEVLVRASGIATAAGSPWGAAFQATASVYATAGTFDGDTATACIEGIYYTLGPVRDWSILPEAASLKQSGHYVLALYRDGEAAPLGLLALRPRISHDLDHLLKTCQRHGVKLEVIARGNQVALQACADRAHIPLLECNDTREAIRIKQQAGTRVAFVSDNAGASSAFATCDLAIGMTDDRSRLPAHVDLLVPDLSTIAAILDTAAQRDVTLRDSARLSMLSNVVGALWGWRAMPDLDRASRVVSIASLAAMAAGWLRLRGGEQTSLRSTRLVDPHPERWGQRSIEHVLHLLHTSEDGLSSEEATSRMQPATNQQARHPLLKLLLEQLRSPLIGVYAVCAGVALFLGATGDVVIIAATILANVGIGVWQEHKANRVAEALADIGTSTARVLRDGQATTIQATDIVVGDVLLLAAGDRVAADARILSAHGLEVDEAALTGESLPVRKMAREGNNLSRIILEGSDITTGSGRAVVVAVGHQTRIGATTAALAIEETQQSPLGTRLNKMMHILFPLSLAGGGIVIAAGLLHGHTLISQLTLGITVILAVIPEGLPLLASVGEAAVARRLSHRSALVRRLSSVEALGRVDVACTDKTGTLTQGRLALSLVADNDQDVATSDTTELPAQIRQVLLAAALACPHPDAPDANAHPTDITVIKEAQHAGLGEQLRVEHTNELAFDPVRSFHVTVAQSRLYLKGAPEVVLARCGWRLQQGERQALDEEGRQEVLAHAQRLASNGLRVLMIAEGSPETPLDDPHDLTVLGFVGISDPLRPTVPATVRRCREAGVRVIMITGDHPATARAIGREAGLLDHDTDVLTGSQVMELPDSDLDARMEHVSIIARATPLDKLRIIESLQRHGHTVAMTGDGVNDAPALRLADVGVAMGRSGTEVARQTADVVLADDDFSTLVEAFVEGRSFWHNIRRSLGLLLGGNLGELGLVIGASLLGNSMPLTTRQILAINVITDLLPATAVALQQPEHRNLAQLHREGTTALDTTIRNDLIRRAVASAAPALVSYLVMSLVGLPAQASTVAFASIVATQLAQTLDAGRAEGHLTPSVLSAVAGSGSMMLATLTVPPLRGMFNLVALSPLGWLLIGGGAIGAVAMNRAMASSLFTRQPHTPHATAPAEEVNGIEGTAEPQVAMLAA